MPLGGAPLGCQLELSGKGDFTSQLHSVIEQVFDGPHKARFIRHDCRVGDPLCSGVYWYAQGRTREWLFLYVIRCSPGTAP